MIAANNPVPCGNHTDGNGIIMDTFLDETTNTIPLCQWRQGHPCIQNIQRHRGNNTAHGNGTDTCINGYYLGDLT
jgi:hypothetical protein